VNVKRFHPSGGQIARALLLFAAALAVGRLLRPVPEVEGLPTPIPTAATYDSSMAYLHGDLSAAASQLVAPRPAGPDRDRVVALLRAADWQVCEDLGRQLRELQRHLAPDSVLLVWTEPDDVPVMEYRLKRERIAARVSAGPALDSVFSTGRRLPTPAVIYVSGDGSRADGITHTRRIPGVRTRSFAEELPLVRRLQRPSLGKPGPGAGTSSTSESEPPS
jgi:hypothetical protein